MVDSVEVIEPIAPITLTFSTNTPTCNGATNGAAIVVATGGTPGFNAYTYQWDANAGSQTTSSATNLAAGTYGVTITDQNGCIATNTVTVGQPATAVSASISNSTDVNCTGSNSGSATVAGAGGTAPYTYSWSNGQSGPTASGLAAGSYTATVTDAQGCTATATVQISTIGSLSVSGNVVNNPSSIGASDGSASAAANSGTAPYSYLWSNGQTAATATSLSAGTYGFTITDANGCSGSGSVTLVDPNTNLIVNAVVDSNATCAGGNDGGVSVSVSGGLAPYTYLWSNGATTASISSLTAGTYIVTVTDNLAQTATDTVVILDGPAINIVVNDASCNGANDGSFAANGGNGPYTWNIVSLSPRNFNAYISLGRDDAEEAQNGGVRRGGSLQLVFATNNIGNQLVANLFRNVSIPQGATIVNAYVQYTSFNNADINPSSMTIRAEASDNAPLILTQQFNLSTRPQTTASVGWSANSWSVAGIRGVDQRTPNIAPVIQEVVNRPGWSGNRMNILISGNGRRNAFSRNNSAINAPQLFVEYLDAGSNSPTNLTAGDYIVTVTDANGCTVTETVSIGESSPVQANAVVLSNATC